MWTKAEAPPVARAPAPAAPPPAPHSAMPPPLSQPVSQPAPQPRPAAPAPQAAPQPRPAVPVSAMPVVKIGRIVSVQGCAAQVELVAGAAPARAEIGAMAKIRTRTAE